jgi:hypothetical protein
MCPNDPRHAGRVRERGELKCILIPHRTFHRELFVGYVFRTSLPHHCQHAHQTHMHAAVLCSCRSSLFAADKQWGAPCTQHQPCRRNAAATSRNEVMVEPIQLPQVALHLGWYFWC